MRKVYLAKCLATMALGIIMTGCSSDDVAEQTKTLTEEEALANAEEKLGVTIDPNQNWQMTKDVTANVTVNLGLDENYTVSFYNENPLFSENPTFYGEIEIKEGGTGSLGLTIPSTDSLLYATVYDSKQRQLTQNVSIEDSIVNVAFGDSVTNANSRRANTTDSDAREYAYTFNDFLNYPKTSIWESTPETINANGMKNWTAFTDNDINNANLNGNSWSKELDELISNNGKSWYLCNGDGHHYRIASGTEITESFTMKGGVRNNSAIYVEGTLHVSDVEFYGPTIIIGSTGKLILDGDLTLSGNGRFLVMEGGQIIASKKNVSLNVSNGAPCYNAGTINYTGTLNVNGCTFYNCGNINIDTFKATAENSYLINFGTIHARTTSSVANGHNQRVVNGCHISIDEDFGCKSIVMLNNSRLDVGGEFYNANNEYSSNKNILNHASVINVGKMNANSAAFIGPTTRGQYAIIKMNHLYINQVSAFKAYNYTYIDWANYPQAYNSNDNSLIDTNNSYWKTFLTYIPLTISESSSIISIPNGDCTGAGYNPDGHSGTKVNNNYPIYTYAFEDTKGGDYDMNDVVIKVQQKNRNKIDITIVAVGATLDLYIRKYEPFNWRTLISRILWGEHPYEYLTYNGKSEVHEMFGAEKGTMINTGKGAVAQPITITIDKGDYDPANLPLSIVSESQGEINLAGSGESPYGIIIPGNWNWPKEQVSITIAYPTFSSFAETYGAATNWYQNVNSNSIMNEASLGY